MLSREKPGIYPTETKPEEGGAISSSDKIRAYFEKYPIVTTASSEALKQLPKAELKRLEGEIIVEHERVLDLCVKSYDKDVSDELRYLINNRLHTLKQAKDEIWEAVGLKKDKQMIVDTDLTRQNRDVIAAAHDRLMASVEAEAKGRAEKDSASDDEKQQVA